MKIILRIYDLVKSWVYYPKMKKYLKNLGINYEKRGKNRLKYSLWHCRTGKLSDIGYENLKPDFEDVSDGWKRVYDREPIRNER